MLVLRIRQAEVALADGRLEEACEIVRQPEVRRHRQGQRLVSRLVEALVARGRSHLAADRPTEALRDATLARELGGSRPEAAALEAEARQAATAAHNQAQQRHDLAQQARDALDRGELTRAGELVARGAAKGLPMSDAGHELERLREQGEACVALTEQALACGDVDAALAGLERARAAHPTSERVAALSRAVAAMVAEAVDRELSAGRLARAASLLHRAEPVASHADRFTEQRQAVRQCRSAAEATEVGDIDEAAATLRRLRTLLPDADWLGACLEQVDRARLARDAIREGPLGGLTLFAGEAGPMPEPRDAPPAAPSPEPPTPTLPTCFYLQVEGSETVLVVRGGAVVLGPVSGRQRVHVPLMLPAGAACLRIERSADEHIAVAEPSVIINGEPFTRRPLLDGDRIALGPRGSARYARPHPASATAVLDLENARLERADVRRVVLLHGPVVIGAGKNAHVRAGQLAQPIVVHEQAGVLRAKLNRGDGPDAVTLVPGKPASVAGVQLEVIAAHGP